MLNTFGLGGTALVVKDDDMQSVCIFPETEDMWVQVEDASEDIVVIEVTCNPV